MALLSEENYLAAERATPARHDYLAGVLHPLAPASPAQALLSTNVLALLATQAHGQEATVVGEGIRLYAPEGPLFTYPDAALVLGPAQLRPDGHDDTLLNPTLLVNILPHPMPDYFPQVFELYYSIPSVEHVLLVTAYAARVSLGTRQPGGLLSVHGFRGLDAVIDLPDLELTLPLDEIYRNVPLRA